MKTEAEFSFIFGQSALLFTTPQKALECVLEALGVPVYNTPVILPCLAPVELVAAVLRSNGLPMLLDVNETGTGYDLPSLQEALSHLEEAVVIHYRPFGCSIPKEDLALSNDFVTIQVSNTLNLVAKEHIHQTTFAIYDLAPAIQKGAVVYSKFSDQRGVLKQVKSGVLGVNDSLSDLDCTQGYEYFKKVDQEKIIRYYPIKVKNAEMAKALLHSEGVESELGRVLLTSYKEVKARFTNVPTYTNGEKLHNTLLLIPAHKSMTSLDVAKIFYNLQSIL